MKRFVFRTVLPLVLVLLSVAGYLWLSYPRQSDGATERQGFVLDTVVRIKVYGTDSGTAAKRALDEMRQVENLADVHHKDSWVSFLNRKRKLSWSPGEAAKSDQAVFPPYLRTKHFSDMRSILRLSRRIASQTDGAFDPTIGPLVELWSVGKKNRIPNDKELKGILPHINYRLMAIGKDGVFLKNQVQLDLGGILKGYAVDRAVEKLKNEGATAALVSAVSSIRALGSKPGGGPWKVGVENPRPQKEAPLLTVLKLPGGSSVSTSGDYQQYFERDGRRYHHVLDPKTGQPASDYLSLTVVTARSAAEADALSTALFVMGYPQAFEWAKEQGDIALLAVTADGKVRSNPAMRKLAEDTPENIHLGGN